MRFLAKFVLLWSVRPHGKPRVLLVSPGLEDSSIYCSVRNSVSESGCWVQVYGGVSEGLDTPLKVRLLMTAHHPLGLRGDKTPRERKFVLPSPNGTLCGVSQANPVTRSALL